MNFRIIFLVVAMIMSISLLGSVANAQRYGRRNGFGGGSYGRRGGGGGGSYNRGNYGGGYGGRYGRRG